MRRAFWVELRLDLSDWRGIWASTDRGLKLGPLWLTWGATFPGGRPYRPGP